VLPASGDAQNRYRMWDGGLMAHREHPRLLATRDRAEGGRGLAMVAKIAALQAVLEAAYLSHPDAPIISSSPGLGTVRGACLLSEIGDDRTRFADARGLKAIAGTAPVTCASGMKTVGTRRVIRNKQLGQVAYLWAQYEVGPYED
jgi:transposase